ncbi:hypothetical protein B0H15DRAFT_957083 [Mycena belliarum]|uniref:Uncharacterized protein n=1 Tax=Mycena belliarum TaxID=1033014 RepID=A0AAD6TN75_9AGAR|nr:hypothetical protein B0H15DRAFT_957083 [Mycena belliae]
MPYGLKSSRTPLTDEEKCLRHSAAQRRYVEKNAEDVRTKARIRMEQRRAKIKLTENGVALAAEHRREIDANYREKQRQKKFVQKFGRRAFRKHYLPLYETTGNGRHLPGVEFAWNDVTGASKHPGRLAKHRDSTEARGKSGASGASTSAKFIAYV